MSVLTARKVTLSFGPRTVLLEVAEDYARKHGCPRIVVATANHRSGAHAFYERLGWEWTGRRYGKLLP